MPLQKKIFIAAPLSAYSSNEYEEKRDEMLLIAEMLMVMPNVSSVFYAGMNLTEKTNFDNPEKAILEDFLEIKNCNVFILVYPKKIVTSALIEIGYALCMENKEIGVFVNSLDDLPFLLTKIDRVYKNTNINLIGTSLKDSIEKYIQKIP